MIPGLSNKDKINTNSKKMPALSLGLNMAVGMGVFTFIGFKIDQRNGTHHWTLGGMFLGLIYCGYEVWKVIRGSNK